MDFSALTPTQRKLLKNIARKTEIRTDKYKLDDVEYLRSLGLIRVCSCDKPGDFYYQAFISEKGKAFLHGYKVRMIGERITQLLAVLAFLLSVLNTFTPFPEWIQELIATMLTK